MTNEEKQPTQPIQKPPAQAQAGAKRKSAASAKRRSRLPRWARITLKILRLLLVPALCVIALIGGLIVGYVYIGDQDMSDVWKFETWKHVFDLMFAEK